MVSVSSATTVLPMQAVAPSTTGGQADGDRRPAPVQLAAPSRARRARIDRGVGFVGHSNVLAAGSVVGSGPWCPGRLPRTFGSGPRAGGAVQPTMAVRDGVARWCRRRGGARGPGGHRRRITSGVGPARHADLLGQLDERGGLGAQRARPRGTARSSGATAARSATAAAPRSMALLARSPYHSTAPMPATTPSSHDPRSSLSRATTGRMSRMSKNASNSAPAGGADRRQDQRDAVEVGPVDLRRQLRSRAATAAPPRSGRGAPRPARRARGRSDSPTIASPASTDRRHLLATRGPADPSGRLGVTGVVLGQEVAGEQRLERRRGDHDEGVGVAGVGAGDGEDLVDVGDARSRAAATISSPVDVRRTDRPAGSKICTCSSDSSAFMARDSAGWATWSWAAAAVIVPVSAVATRYRSCCRFIPGGYRMPRHRGLGRTGGRGVC